MSNEPSTWGPQMWFTLHNGATAYPRCANPVVRYHTKRFILGLPYMIPCMDCAHHMNTWLQQVDVDAACVGREQLFDFYVALHNHVNERLDKPTVTYHEARVMYMYD